MRVIRAEVLGYCMGVRRAVEAAELALSSSGDGSTVHTLGPLIHNPSVLSSLSERGVRVLGEDGIASLGPSDVVVIRAHGTTPLVERLLHESGATVVDATCPRVHASQRRASEWSAKGYTVIVAGDRNHGEVTSLEGYASGRCLVVQTVPEAEALSVPERAVLLAQTTFSSERFAEIASVLKSKNPGLVVFDSICSATRQRQEALRKLSGVDGILVLGGRLSANTRRLYDTALSISPRAALIEGVDEIPGEFFSLETVGLTAGASTPELVISAVEKRLLSCGVL